MTLSEFVPSKMFSKSLLQLIFENGVSEKPIILRKIQTILETGLQF